ncbi:MAG: hypothetical protein ACKVH8_04790 [Pirellulales bacterium]
MNTKQPDRQAILEELDQLRNRMAQLERELAGASPNQWEQRDYYLSYYATAGFFLGMIGAITSLVFNVVGAAMVGKHPLELISVYLTFPLGEKAMELEGGMALLIGCCLYIATGMVLGVFVHVGISKLADSGDLFKRLAVATVLGAFIWVINFYCLISWMQPAMFGGTWIIDSIPWYIGLLTHLVFTWTMALVYPMGVYVPYQPESEKT